MRSAVSPQLVAAVALRGVAQLLVLVQVLQPVQLGLLVPEPVQESGEVHVAVPVQVVVARRAVGLPGAVLGVAQRLLRLLAPTAPWRCTRSQTGWDCRTLRSPLLPSRRRPSRSVCAAT